MCKRLDDEFQTGIGISFYYSFGIPYVDDNSGKTQSPLLLAVVTSARTLGPTFGYILATFCLKVYVEPRNEPKDIDEDDPRYVVALVRLSLLETLISYYIA